MKKFKRLVGMLSACASLLFTFTACNNSFSPQSSDSSAQGQEQQQAQNGGVSYSPEALATPLTLEACGDGAVVTFVNKATGPVTYKVNGGTEQTIASGATGTITLESIEDKVEFFGDNKAYATNYSNYSNIACSADCYVYGNIMSLVKSQGFEKETALEEGYTFAYFFRNNAHIKNKSGADLLLPATTLAGDCYSYMFNGCANLTAAPNLPATTLAGGCYANMFEGCARLTTAPSLPATILADYCYNYMFYGCTNLTAAPELKATTLAANCYSGMFNGCSNLTAAPSLPVATLAYACYSYMFSGCASLTAAPELPATTLANSCYGNMFNGCASLTAAPNLPATTLANYCYSYMFSGCTKLSSVTCLATNISASNCTTNWLNGVAASGAFTKADGMTGWTTDSASGIPSGWTVRDFSYSVPLTLEACVNGAVVTFSNKAAGPVTYKVNGGEAQTIASGATKTITLSAISDKVEFFGDNKAYATNLGNYSNIACDKDCYVYGNIMSLVNSAHFEKATALEEGFTFACLFKINTHIKNKSGAPLLLPATTLADSCYSWMFQGCASLTAAPSLPATSLATWCYSYMFSGCASLTAAPSLPATSLATWCYDHMFSGCASLTDAPDLPATTLTEACYPYMFSGCASLASVTCLATDISAIVCTTDWLDGVAANGTFTKAAGMNDWPTNSKDGIPSGWTVVDKQ